MSVNNKHVCEHNDNNYYLFFIFYFFYLAGCVYKHIVFFYWYSIVSKHNKHNACHQS